MNKDNYHEQGNIIIMLLLLPLGHISNIRYIWILKGRQTMMVSVTIEKARLVVKMFFDKFKELTTMRLSHS